MTRRVFCPSATTYNIDVSSSNQNVKVTDCSGPVQIRVFNDGSATAWIAFGTDTNAAAALASGIPVGSKEETFFTAPGVPVYAAAIAAASTGKIYFTPGSLR
jgi:hypothetical protein